MQNLSKELVFLMLQFLDEEKYKDTVHSLERDSGYFFNLRHFEEMVTNGDWDNAEKYLFGFTKVDENRYSMKMFFEIRKQKYLEALDKSDRAKAVEILVKDLRSFSTFNEDLYKEITYLITLDNFRSNEQLARYGDTRSARAILFAELKKLIEANPMFQDKLNFPTFKNSRLRTLINQSLNWQHQLCKNPKANPDIKTLFVDHSCGTSQANGSHAPLPVTSPLIGSLTRGQGFPPLVTHNPFQQAPAVLSNPLAGWITNLNQASAPHAITSAGPPGFTLPSSSASILKRPRSPPHILGLEYPVADSEHVPKRTGPFRLPEEVNNPPGNALSIGYAAQSHGQSSHASDDFPKTVVMNLNMGSAVKSMDFHPSPIILLLVAGTNTGDVMVWDIGTRVRLAVRKFKIWDIVKASLTTQASMTNDYSVSVNRVIWAPDGSLFGVAFSKHLVHIYSYHGGGDIRNHLEIDAHVGSVNDLAFSSPNKQQCIVTCGDDRFIKVWDAVSGAMRFTFDGHQAPVHSVCPHHKASTQFLFSTSTDGKVKAWLYDHMGPRADYDAPGHASTRMAYNTDGTRLFSCGTNKEGNSFLIEWNEGEGSVKHTYNGLGKRSEGVVQFDTTKNQYLAAGDEFMVKFWDMDNICLLTTIDAEGGLPASPCIRFNKDGFLLAVSTNDNGVKILATSDGVRILRATGLVVEPSRVGSSSMAKTPSKVSFGVNNASVGSNNMDLATLVQPMASTNGDNIHKADSVYKITEIIEPTQCHSLRLPDNLPAQRVSRLIYTNSGLAILALSADAVHKLWKWQKCERNASGKATASIPPQLWQPASGILMTNDLSNTKPEDAVSCFALSKNDSYVMSASGGQITLFNMMTFKTMTSFMPPPPAATFLAFHPKDNNIVAIGMEDSSIQIYNARIDEVTSKLQGHQNRITGLAFSNILNVLISSGADAQLCVWGTDGWEKQISKTLELPSGSSSSALIDTHIQFHIDQVQLLVVHETQLGIYGAPKMELMKQWVSNEGGGPITYATYSCDGQSVYASFQGGSVGVFMGSALQLRCLIKPSSYLPANLSSQVHPVVVAAHPTEPNQFALGLTDGGVIVFEPNEAQGRWGSSPLPENEAGSSSFNGATKADQPQK